MQYVSLLENANSYDRMTIGGKAANLSGLVLEVGGQLSHGAIIAREYGIPAAINVPGALHFIQDGQTIEVDGTNGRVYLDVTSQIRLISVP